MDKKLWLRTLLAFFAMACSSHSQISEKMEKFSKCPDKPNCVCSLFIEDKEHFIEPLRFEENPIERSQKILKELGMKIIASDEFYIHALAVTKIMRFKDDVELMYDQSTKLLHFKSASRVGYSDLGANKKRIDLIKSKL